MRQCTHCHEIMVQGYHIQCGEYYCSEDCLQAVFTNEEIEELAIGEDESESYWTEWTDEGEIKKAFLLFDNLYLHEKVVQHINRAWANKEHYDTVYIHLTPNELDELDRLKLAPLHKKCELLQGKYMHDTMQEAIENYEN